MKDNNHYLAKGNSYLIEVYVPEDISDEDRKNAEYKILSSVFRDEELLKGIETKAFYRANLTSGEAEQTKRHNLLLTIKDDIRQFIEELSIVKLDLNKTNNG